ncbi:hypothetical protein DFJ74DRAFT_697413 [Hyaloraphidium curvatum]|nr:hypothetical protein DFJ74DRAFT_698065 [Hyaloraphidium curvatum]KAI9001866.1 hypothetical protein DFJ74DRAFT_697413 [Hyaloraphidium curvatum]
MIQHAQWGAAWALVVATAIVLATLGKQCAAVATLKQQSVLFAASCSDCPDGAFCDYDGSTPEGQVTCTTTIDSGEGRRLRYRSYSLQLGQACVSNAECSSTYCVESVCCNIACTGTCMSCLAARTGGVTGACTGTLWARDFKKECTTDGCFGPGPCECGRTCNGYGACAITAIDIPCGGPRCNTPTVTNRYCDGIGNCTVRDSTVCGGGCTESGCS